jgi:hypothetical protein
MNKLNIQYHRISILLLLFIAYNGKSQNAPITTASQLTACPNTTITIALTVTGFNDIGSFQLFIRYYNSVMSYNNLNTSHPNLISTAGPITFSNVQISGDLYEMRLIWTSNPPASYSASIPDGETLATIGFNYNNGSTSFSFDNISNNGHNCEFTRIILVPFNVIQLNDIPDSVYYHNGQVGPVPLPPNTPRTWTGSISGDWANSNNWNPCGVPVVTENVEIPVTSHNPVIGTTGFSCNNLLVKNGATLTVNAPFTCRDVHMENNGTLHVNPAITMTVTGACTIDP